MVVEPLELEILATLIKRDHEVEIVDMILEKRSLNHFLEIIKPDVLCITGYITHIPVILEYCRIAKEKHSLITIAGGVHIEKFPEDIDNQYIDYRIVRNATTAFPNLIKYICKKSDFPVGVLRSGEKLNEDKLPDYDFYVPVPDRSLTTKYRNKYFYVTHNRVALIKTSFGCPYSCRFCFCRKITGDKYFARPLKDVMEELETIREKEVYIVDDDFLLNRERINEFISLLKQRKIDKRYLIYGRADFIASNPEIIKSFRSVGLRTIIVGLESFEDAELNDYNKKTNSSINKLAMQILNKNKVDCYAAIIIPPSWDKSIFIKASKIMRELGIKFVNLQPLTPLKGTGIEISDDSLLIKRDDFARWDLAHVTIRPEKMSVMDFYKSILWLYKKVIYNPRNLIYNTKYPLKMQLKLVTGMIKVHNQYRKQIMGA